MKNILWIITIGALGINNSIANKSKMDTCRLFYDIDISDINELHGFKLDSLISDAKTKNDVNPIISPIAPIPIEIRIIANPSFTIPEIIRIKGRTLVFKDAIAVARKRFLKQVDTTSNRARKTSTVSMS